MIRTVHWKRPAAQWPVPAQERPLQIAAGNRVGTLLALFITGFATFINLYATQPLLPQFRQVFHASELLVSLTVSAPVLAVALMAPLIGLVADGVGRKSVIVGAMLGLAVPTVLVASAHSLLQIIVWRFCQGFFIPGIIAVAMAYISEESPPQSAGSTMATYVTGGVVGGFAGRFITGFGAVAWGWRAAFVVLGMVTLVGALVTWWQLPRSRHFVRQNNAAASLQSLRRHLRNPQLLATCAAGFNVLFCLVGTFTYVNFYLANKPFDFGPAALASIFAVYLIGAVITPVAGYIQDRIGYRRALLGAVAIAVLGMLMTLLHHVVAIIVGLTLAASGAFACQSAASSHVGKAAGMARSSAAGLYVALYYLGGSVGSVVPGLFWNQTGWAGCVAIVVVMQFITAMMVNKMWQD